MSKLDDIAFKRLNEKANTENASENDILKAALMNNQEQYRELSERLIVEMRESMSDFDSRLKAIEIAITKSNKEKDINITSALQNASETIIGQLQGKFGELDKAIDQRITKLKDAELNADNANYKFIAIVVVIFALVFFAVGYGSNYVYGKYYDLPAKVKAINDGMYELLHPIKNKVTE